MNILIIHDVGYAAGGAEILLLGVRKELERRGHVVRVLSSRHMGNTFSEYEFQSVDRGRMGKIFSYLYNPFSALKLRSILKDFRPDIVHLHTIEKASPSILPVLRRVPTVLSVHDYGLFYPKLKELLPDGTACSVGTGACCFEHVGMRLYWERLRMTVFLRLMGSIDLVIPNSAFMRDVLVRIGYPRVSETGRIGATLFPPSEDGFKPHSLLYLGRLEREKGVRYLISAFALIIRDVPDATLTIVGSGSERDDLKRMTADLGLEGWVRFISAVSNEDAGEYYRRAAVVVVPSVWAEPFGLVGVEAMSVGRPVIATRVGGIPEWLRDGENGILVDPADPTQIAKAAKRLFGDVDAYRRLSSNAKKDAASYGMSQYAESIEREYGNVIDAGGYEAEAFTLGVAFERLWKDSLYRNSFFLAASSVIMSGLGFLFWMVNTHLFATNQVGLATTLITTMTLIANFSMLGLNVSLVKYLPKSERKTEKINSVLIVTGTFSLVLAAVYGVWLSPFTPELSFLRGDALSLAVFLMAAVGTSLHRVMESVFIAFRDTAHVLSKNVIFSLLKLSLPILFVSLASIGILLSWSVALVLSFVYCVVILYRRYGYRFRTNLDLDLIRRMMPYSAGNYVADFFGTLPSLILPLLITGGLGAERTAFFYVAFMIAGLLFIIPESLGHSLFAEGSHDENGMRKEAWKAAFGSLLCLLPAIVLIFLFGEVLLLPFGKMYSVEGTGLLRILSLSAIPYTFNSIFGAMLKVKQEIRLLVAASLVGSVAILGLAVFAMPSGLTGIGAAWGIGQALLSSFYLLAVVMRNPFGPESGTVLQSWIRGRRLRTASRRTW